MNAPYVFKKCSKCGEWLVANNINFNKSKKGKYRLQAYCKKCKAKQQKQYREKNKGKIKQYYEDNKDKILEQCKQYREKNREKIKQYYKENKDKIAEQQKQYYKENKDKIAERHKQWCDENKDKILKKSKQYYKENKDKVLEQCKQYREVNRDKIAEYFKQRNATPQGQIANFNRRNRRRLKEQNQGSGITEEQWLEMMKYFNWECAYSGECIGYKNTRSIDHITPISRGGEHEIWNVVPMYRPYNSSKQDKDLLEWYKEQDFYSEERLQKIYEWQEYAFTKYGK